MFFWIHEEEPLDFLEVHPTLTEVFAFGVLKLEILSTNQIKDIGLFLTRLLCWISRR